MAHSGNQEALTAEQQLASRTASKAVHFHSGDDRFCGDTTQFRRFSTEPNEITCRACMKRDTFILSQQAAAYVASLESAQ